MNNGRQRESDRIAGRGHRAREWATRDPIDKWRLRDVVCREPVCLIVVIDIDTGNELRLGNGGEEAVEQLDVLLLLLGGWLCRPAAKSILDIGKNRDSGDPRRVVPGVQRGLTLLLTIGIGVSRAIGATQSPVAMHVILADITHNILLDAVETI